MSDEITPCINISVLSFEEAPPPIDSLQFLAGYSKIIIESDGSGPHLPKRYWEIDIFRIQSNNPFILLRHSEEAKPLLLITDPTFVLVDYDVLEIHSKNIMSRNPIINYEVLMVLESPETLGRLHIDLATIFYQ